jgi:hypothetical protein
MIQYIKRAAVVLASIAAGYVCLGVPEAHSSTPAAQQNPVSQAPEELANKLCTAAGCASRCSPASCQSFHQNNTGGCTYVCGRPSDKSETKPEVN